MDYEKKYKEALKKARQLCVYPTTKPFISDLQDIFPELTELEDEKIRKALIQLVKKAGEGYENVSEGISIQKAIAWLEKGEQKHAKNIVETWKAMRLEVYQQASGNRHEPNCSDDTTKMFSLNDIDEIVEKMSEQSSADNVEPKFKVGDWVVFNNKHQSIYQVEKIEDGYYILRHTHGGTFRICVLHDESLRLWTIQEARDLDILACNNEILLFKSYSVQGRISLYCWYNGQTNNFHSKEVNDTLLTTRNKIYPATKEQRDTLEKALADAGYTFDFEKKELKKIEQNTAYWSEEDERYLSSCITKIEIDIQMWEGHGKTMIDGDKEIISWLKSLKDRVQPKQEWKPSENELEVLRLAAEKDGTCLMGLYENLKKLREE